MGQLEVSSVDRQSKCLKSHLWNPKHTLSFGQLSTSHWKVQEKQPSMNYVEATVIPSHYVSNQFGAFK